MATTDQYFSLVSTSKSSWVAVRIQPESRAENFVREIESPRFGESAVRSSRLFSQTQAARADFAERFPRFTIAMISLVLLAVSVTAEVEWLRQAGYHWR
jgi:hypothetical protein